MERFIKERLRFLPWATVVRTSATTGRGINKLLPALSSAIEAHRRRLPTSLVNNLVHDAQSRRPHPRTGGRAHRIYYAAQTGVAPPTFVLFASAQLEPSYVRYIENRIREVEPFPGTPMKIHVRIKTRRQVER
jgi:GTP-binding protein